MGCSSECGGKQPHRKSFGDAIVSVLSGTHVASQYPPVVKNPPLYPADGSTSETLTGPESRLVNFFPDIRVILSVASLPTLIEITH